MAQPHNHKGTHQQNQMPYGISPGDNATQIMGKIASGLGVNVSDPSVMQVYQYLAVAERERLEVRDPDARLGPQPV